MPRTRAVTAEDLAAMGEGRRELIYGEVVEMTPCCGDHGRISSRISYRLTCFLEGHPLGVCFGTDTGYLLARRPDLVRAPDVSFVAAARLAGVDMRKYLPFAPDLAVEVTSPDDTSREVDDKARMWISYGTRLVWVVDPERRRVWIYRPGAPRLERPEGAELSGEDVLPGFVLPVAECL